MSEKDVISKTIIPSTVGSIMKELSNLGIGKGDTLLVHSSLSSLGWVCGGSQAVVEALIAIVGPEGTLVLPSHSGDWSDPQNWSNPPVPKEWVPVIRGNMPAYNKDITPTRGMGRIAELFRRYPGVIRSENPLVSFSALGRQADEIVEYHPVQDHFGIKTPLGKMYEKNAKVLLMGVGYDSCTCFHLSETLVENPPMAEKSGTSMLVNGERKWIEFQTLEYTSDDFPKLGADFEASCKVNKGKVGNADCILFDMKEGVDFAVEWLKKDRKFIKL